MKSTFPLLAIASLLSPMALWAHPRSIEEAREIGTQWVRASNPEAVLTSAADVLSRACVPNYYIFNVSDDAGYVIVSADDRFQEILGYSDHGSYMLMQENPSFQFWLSAMSDEMAAASVAEGGDDAPVYKAKAPDIAPLMKTKWGQGAPYNNECYETGSLRPEIGWKPQHAPTGCVATAMAQVMYYHKWPQVYKNGKISYEFNWDIMEPSYTGEESEESIAQVAYLMKYCGTAVNMRYTVSESGASTFAIPAGMVNDFGYDGSTIRKIWRDSYSYDVLHDMLYTELREGRPIIAGGEYPNVAGGHQFVIDGCNSDDFFHVNWGWEGYCDGYFRLTSMRPADFGTGGREQGYSFNMDFTIGIQPKRNTTVDVMHGVLTPMGDLQVYGKGDDETVWVKYGENNNMSSYAHYYVPVTTVCGEYPGFMNTGAAAFRGNAIGYQDAMVTKLVNTLTGEMTLCHDADYDALGLKPGYYTEALGMYYATPDFDLKEGVPYMATLCYKLYDDDTLYDLQFGPGRRNSLMLERSGDQIKITQPRVENIDVLAEFPSDMDRIVRRDPQNFAVKVTNNSATEYLGGVQWRFRDAQGNFRDEMSDYLMVNVRPGESITDDFTLFNITKAQPGKYTAGLYDYRGRLISSERQVELYDFKLTIDATNFPDADFRQYVSNAFDSDRDGTLSDAELENIREIKLDGNRATDFTGIEHFYNLVNFIVSNGSMTHIDLSACPKLYEITVTSTPLETISLDGNPELGYIEIKETKLKKLDLSNCPKSTHVLVDNNEIETLTLHNASSLFQLNCSKNKIVALDLSGQKGLKYLSFGDNGLRSLNISGLTNIISLNCSYNSLTALDISGMTQLKYMNAAYNAISDFKMASHPELTDFDLSANQISGELDFYGFADLKYLNLSQNALSGLKLGTHPNLSYIRISENSISGDIDLTGYENLTNFSAYDNSLTSLELGNHPYLTQCSVANNKLEGELDLRGCPKIQYVFAQNNNLNKVTLASHPELVDLEVQENNVEGVLDISGAENLEQLWASDNKITELRYDYHPSLWKVILSNNCLTHFNADDFPSINSAYSCYGQEAHFTISTPNFNTKTLAATKFDYNRASDWWASWTDENGQRKSQELSVISGVVMIPDEAGRDVRLAYSYLTNAATNTTNKFFIYLTREGFNGIADITGDEPFIVTDGKISFGEYIRGEIYTPTGVLMYSGSGESCQLPKGIYVVKIGSKATTVAIR